MLTCIIIVYTGQNEENERKSAKRSSEIGGKQVNNKHLEHKNGLSTHWKTILMLKFVRKVCVCSYDHLNSLLLTYYM